ncbi:hypothetical protein HUW62_39825 [Myxococcus sp. AM011]|uniref:hypothetical protein n=1 Tax=Myxococcus sp. AM011 TaxID=2745200 RepID=UPI001594EAE5|nr:hypothetical protein [Myxococcus sp. AM011]NVJ27381.1 hypothetical protein [Myxococcus sp. AM011]
MQTVRCMPHLVLVGPESFPFVRDVLRAEAQRAGLRVVEVSMSDWGTGVTPWVEVVGGRFRAGLLGPWGDLELGPEDVFWCLAEGPPPRAESDYLSSEYEALREAFHTCCPARVINRRGLLAPLWTTAMWRMLAQRLPSPEADSVLAPPHFHLGAPPEDGQRWTRWPEEAETSMGQVWWTVPEPGPLRQALVLGSHVTLWPLEFEEEPPTLPSALERDLTRLAASCGADVLEVLLVSSGTPDASARWTALQLGISLEGLERLVAQEDSVALAQLERFIRARFASKEDAR